jgi:hypothetical protein
MTSEQDSAPYEGIGIYAASSRSGPESTKVFQQGQAHSLGFLDGMNAMQSGGPREPQRRHPRLRRQLTDGEWDEYRRGWDAALDARDSSSRKNA